MTYYMSREDAPRAYGDCDRCRTPDSPLVLCPIAFALTGERWVYLCRECKADRELEA